MEYVKCVEYCVEYVEFVECVEYVIPISYATQEKKETINR